MYFSSVYIMEFGDGIHFIQELCTGAGSFTIKKYHLVFFTTRYFRSMQEDKYSLHLVFRKQYDAK